MFPTNPSFQYHTKGGVSGCRKSPLDGLDGSDMGGGATIRVAGVNLAGGESNLATATELLDLC
jgi:hypothetical protein